MSRDLSRPRRGNRIVPRVDAAAVVVTAGIALGQVEFDETRRIAVENLRADRAPEFGEIGFIRPLARNQDEIGRAKRADCRERQLFGITAANSDEGQREHEKARAAV